MNGGLVLPLFELVVFEDKDILEALTLGSVAQKGLCFFNSGLLGGESHAVGVPSLVTMGNRGQFATWRTAFDG